MNGRVCMFHRGVSLYGDASCNWYGLGTYNKWIRPVGAAFSSISLNNNSCNGWSIRLGAVDYSVIYAGYPEPWIIIQSPGWFPETPNLKRSAFKTDIVSETATGDLNALAQMCSITGEVELPFWSASGAHFTVTIDRTPAESLTPYFDDMTVLQYGNAKFYRGPGCPVCACESPCSRSATLNGVTYDCLPPEINVDLSIIDREGTFPDAGVDGNGLMLTYAAINAVNNIFAMTLPLVSWTGNAATYRYDYQVYTTTYIRYEVTLYCSTVCQPSDSLTTACVKAWLINKSTANPTPEPAWPVSYTVQSGTYNTTINDFRMWYTGNWAAGDELPAPTLTINKTCTGPGVTGSSFAYDASGSQDLGGSSITAGPFNVGGNNIPATIFLNIANISIGVP